MCKNINKNEACVETLKYKNIEYVIRKPENFNTDKKYPMVILLHGAGWRGNDVSVLKEYPLFSVGKEYIKNSVVIMPQCFADTWFDIFEQLKEFLIYAIKNLYADSKRCYLMGASMGAYAAWQIAMSMPEYFAALVPMCGGGMYWNAHKLINMPIHAFHGSEDTTVYCEESRKMVDKINQNGGNATLTVLDGVGHNAWDYVYGNKNLFEWMFEQSL